jgi:hypothetical protein
MMADVRVFQVVLEEYMRRSFEVASAADMICLWRHSNCADFENKSRYEDGETRYDFQVRDRQWIF